jgi:hypothetical protein
MRGAVGGERSALRADGATPAVRRSPTTPASVAATFKARQPNRILGLKLRKATENARTF